MLVKFDSCIRLFSPVKFVIFKTQIFYELCTSGYYRENISDTKLDECKRKKKERNFSLLIENEEIILRLFLALVMYRYCT